MSKDNLIGSKTINRTEQFNRTNGEVLIDCLNEAQQFCSSAFLFMSFPLRIRERGRRSLCMGTSTAPEGSAKRR